jgi:ketosteroid isomerase-like protein
MSGQPEDLHEVIAAYNDAWNAHDVERIAEMHAPDMVFENHTAGERAEGVEALEHIARIFSSCPTSRLRPAGCMCVRTWWCRSGPRRRPMSSR